MTPDERGQAEPDGCIPDSLAESLARAVFKEGWWIRRRRQGTDVLVFVAGTATHAVYTVRMGIEFPNGKDWYYLDGDVEKYASPEALISAIRERFELDCAACYGVGATAAE